MPVEELLEEVGILVQAGRNVIDATPLFNDLGNHVGYAVKETINLTNGTAQEITVLTAGAGASVTTGFGILAVDVGTFGAMVAPALGVLAGIGLYNLAPDFWDDLNQKLINAGMTIGNKVFGLFDENCITHFPETSVEVFKNKLVSINAFSQTIPQVQGLPAEVGDISTMAVSQFTGTPSDVLRGLELAGVIDASFDKIQDPVERLNYKMMWSSLRSFIERYEAPGPITHVNIIYNNPEFENPKNIDIEVRQIKLNKPTIQVEKLDWPANVFSWGRYEVHSNPEDYEYAPVRKFRIFYGPGERPELYLDTRWRQISDWRFITLKEVANEFSDPPRYWHYTDMNIVSDGAYTTVGVQDNATFPTESPIPVTYPTWVPLEAPLCDPTQEEEPGVDPPTTPTRVYPVEIPEIAPLQVPAQNPQPEVNPEPYRRWLPDTLPIPTPLPYPSPYPTPSPIPTVDPDPNTENVPVPDNPAVPETQPQPDPIEPEIPIIPEPTPVVPPVLDTFASTKLFTVYNPSSSQLNSLGAYLWSSSIIDIISKIWSNPLSGIISLHRVYKAPSVGASRNIILGYLDSEVAAPVVSSQFTRFSCGTVNIREQNKNVTDYSPYASVHIYLPFIGIVPLDVDEVMGGSLEVVYTVDMYTGTCLAEIYLTRSPDVTTPKILYSFNGNAGQHLPLTSSDATGLISSIASLGAAAIGVVSGGGALGGAAVAAHSLTHELLHVGHSGSLSSNAGIMGQRKPFVIIGRRYGYDANNYGAMYGYPTNKTVYLGNCGGFTQVKAIQLQSSATENEKEEIVNLLKNGVIF